MGEDRGAGTHNKNNEKLWYALMMGHKYEQKAKTEGERWPAACIMGNPPAVSSSSSITRELEPAPALWAFFSEIHALKVRVHFILDPKFCTPPSSCERDVPGRHLVSELLFLLQGAKSKGQISDGAWARTGDGSLSMTNTPTYCIAAINWMLQLTVLPFLIRRRSQKRALWPLRAL